MNATDETVARLEADWPRWQVWVVHRVVGGPVWCARRWDEHGQVLNAGSADELVEQLEEASASPDYTGYAIYQEAMRAYPGQPAFAAWLCEQHPWGAWTWVRLMTGERPGTGSPGEHHPAGVLARIKVTWPGWTITRSQPDGALTAHRYVGHDLVSIYALDPEAPENRLRDHEAQRAPDT